jgi:hypothetical protein
MDGWIDGWIDGWTVDGESTIIGTTVLRAIDNVSTKVIGTALISQCVS